MIEGSTMLIILVVIGIIFIIIGFFNTTSTFSFCFDHLLVGAGIFVSVLSLSILGSPKSISINQYELSRVDNSSYLTQRGDSYEFSYKKDGVFSKVETPVKNVKLLYSDGTPSVITSQTTMKYLGLFDSDYWTEYTITLPTPGSK